MSKRAVTRTDAHRAILGLAKDGREAVDVKHERSRVTTKIARRLDAIGKRAATRRTKLEEYVRAHGPVRFADGTGAEPVRVPKHVRITDAGAVLASLLEAHNDQIGPLEELGVAYVSLELDRPAFRRWASENLELIGGAVILRGTRKAISGVEVLPEHTTVRVRT